MSEGFWLGVAENAIGSALGFVLGIFAFLYQQRRQSAKKEKDDWKAALDALNRLTTAAGANIEALALVKLQLNGLRPEVEKMKAASAQIYDTPPPERAKRIPALIALSGSLRHFYTSLPRTSVVPPPEVSEYSLLSRDMPALALFVHRAMGIMQELNERIASRNAHIAGNAHEGGAGTGMTAERVNYYSSMLADEGAAVCELTDDAMDFWRLVLEQVKAYMTARASEYFLEYKLVPAAEKAMPEEELFPLMRERLATFEKVECGSNRRNLVPWSRLRSSQTPSTARARTECT